MSPSNHARARRVGPCQLDSVRDLPDGSVRRLRRGPEDREDVIARGELEVVRHGERANFGVEARSVRNEASELFELRGDSLRNGVRPPEDRLRACNELHIRGEQARLG